MLKYYFFVLVLLFSACSNGTESIPSNIIPKDTMMFVLMDIHIAEAGARTLTNDTLNKTVVNYYRFIEEKYHVSDAQFKESMLFYSNHPKLLEDIYSKMTEEMSKKEAEQLKNK